MKKNSFIFFIGCISNCRWLMRTSTRKGDGRIRCPHRPQVQRVATIRNAPFIILISTIFVSSFTYAQKLPLPCARYKIDLAAEKKARQFRSSGTYRPLAVNTLLRVYFHIVTNDDGTNAPITPEQIKTEFATLLASYSPDNICFLNAGTDYVKNTFLNTLFNADNDPEGSFFTPYQVPRCINIFYTQVIKGNNNACNPPCGYGGIALGGIPGTFFLVSKANIGPGSTVSHEIGHSLGLLHTFETGSGFEKIDGSNSLTTGDRVQDTPADPFAYNGSPCFTVKSNDCLYSGTCPDSNNATNFNPPYANLMAYWWNGTDVNGFFVNCYPTLSLTNGQFSRVNDFLQTYTPLINCSSAANVTVSGINISSGYYMNSAISVLNTTDSVLFNGSAKATLGGQTVHLQNGFHANPSAGGQVKIIANPCN